MFFTSRPMAAWMSQWRPTPFGNNVCSWKCLDSLPYSRTIEALAMLSDQELVSYRYSAFYFSSSFSFCLSLYKSLALCRFKSDRDDDLAGLFCK